MAAANGRDGDRINAGEHAMTRNDLRDFSLGLVTAIEEESVKLYAQPNQKTVP
jgi:hypothetical protein